MQPTPCSLRRSAVATWQPTGARRRRTGTPGAAVLFAPARRRFPGLPACTYALRSLHLTIYTAQDAVP